MKVLETRTDGNGLVRRRRRALDGTSHWTIEVPMVIWERLNRPGRGSDRTAAILRVQQRQSEAVQARLLHARGWSMRAVARHLDVSDSTVRRWVSEKGISGK